MESLKSQFVLRSMDMEGRSLGTERPPVSTERGGSGETRAEFASLLTSRARDARRSAGESVEDRMAARIRDGRTDAAREDHSVRDDVRQRQAPAADQRQERARPEDRFGPERSGDEPGGDSRASSRGSDLTERRAGAAPGRTAASSNEDARGSSDSSDDAHVDAGTGDDVQGSAGTLLTPVADRGVASAAVPRGGVQRPGAVAPVAQILAPGQRVPGAPQPQLRFGPESAVKAAANTAAAKASKPTAASAPTTSLERADAILEQLKVAVTSGSREARIQLRPADLGFIEMKIKAGGKDGVQARIAVERPETLAVLEAHLPELRAWLSKDAEGPVEIDLSLLDPDGGASQSETGDAAGGDTGSSGSPQGGGAPGFSHPAAARAALTQALARTQTTDGVDFVA